MLHLRAFGTVRLTRDDGESLESVASQRRMLALLSILAVAGETGVSRERIVALLWPDGDSDRGRSSLSQCVYSARKLLRCESIFRTSGDVLALNTAHITSDVGEFVRAVDAGQHGEAANHFTGDFLEDFHAPGLVDFDHWMESQRARFREAADSVFAALAAKAERSGDWAHAVEWRRRQSSLAPYNGFAAHRLATALRNGGDRAAALAHLRTHAALVRADLEMDPDASVVALMEELRQSVPTPPAAPQIAGLVAPALVPEVPASVVQVASRNKRRSRVVAGLVGTLALAAGGWLWFHRSAAPRAQDTIVAPFRLSGADPSVGFLREGLVEMVAARLDGSEFGVVDAATSREAWLSEGIGGDDRPKRELSRLARRLGAKRILLGSVVGDQRRVILTTAAVDASSQNTLGIATVEGPLDSLSSMADHLAAQLLLIETGERGQFSMSRLPRLPALRAYLQGQVAYHQGSYLSALHAYEKSVAADSSFALGALQLAITADRLNAFEQQQRAITIAWTNRDQLSVADRRRLTAFVGPDYPAPSLRREQLAAIENALRSSHDRVDMLVEFAQRYVRLGSLMQVSDSGARARALLARASQINPEDKWVRATQAFVASVSPPSDSTGSFRGELGDVPTPLRWRMAVEGGRDEELAAIRQRLGDLDTEQLIQIARMSLFDAIGASDGDLALSAWQAHAKTEVDRVGAILARHAVALNNRDSQRALQLTQRLAEVLPGSRAHLRLRVLDALYGPGDLPAAKAAAARLALSVARLRETSGEAERVSREADACVSAQWQLAQGHLVGIDDVISHLRSAPLPRVNATLATAPQACAALLEAWADVDRNSPRATDRLARLDSLILAGPAVGDAAAYAPILIARLYERLGDPQRALDALRRRPYLAGWPRYLATVRRKEQALMAILRDQPAALPAVSPSGPLSSLSLNAPFR